MNVELIDAFAPKPDESGLGYYRRLSAANGFLGWRQLARLAELSDSRAGLLSRPEHVASVLGLALEWAQHASNQEAAARAWNALRRTSRDAVCPHCVGESPHMRAIWEHAYCVACPEHEVLLLDTCDGCGQPLKNTRDHIELCECGRRISDMKAAGASPAQLWLSSLLVTQGRSSGLWTPAVRNTSVDMLVELVRGLCILHDPHVAPPRMNSAVPRSVAESISLLAPLDALLADWPRGFEAHVSARIAAGTPEARTLNTLLGRWYLRLTAVATNNELSPFLEAVARVAAAEFTGVIGLDRGAPVLLEHATHLLAQGAAARIGVHRDTLVSRIREGQVKHRINKRGTRGAVYEVPVEEVDAIIEARKLWATEDQACALLGVPKGVLQLLLEAGLLVTADDWRRDVRKGGPILLSSASSLVHSLRNVPVYDHHPGGRLVFLRELNGRRGDKKALAEALRAIASGAVRPVAKADLPGNQRYALADISKYFSRPVLEAGLSVQELSETTGWKWESIEHWIALGLLESNTIKMRGQPCRVVMPHQLASFTRTYIPLADVARQLGTKSSALSARLADVELVGAQTLPNGSRRGGLVRIADLASKALAA